MGYISHKQKVFNLLKEPDFDEALRQLADIPPGRILKHFFSALCDKDEELKWRAVTAMGVTVAKTADTDMEGARTIMRRLMWSLNDESGGIGWGAPEAMGEIMANHAGIAEEFAHVLVSYAREDGNFLEYELLQRGLMWGLGRLAQARPELLKDDVQYILPYMESNDSVVKGLAAWTLGLLNAEEARSGLEKLLGDDTEIELYLDRILVVRRLTELAAEALKNVKKQTQAGHK